MIAQSIHNGLAQVSMDKLQFVLLSVEMELSLEMKSVMMETIWQMTDVLHVKSKIFTHVLGNHQYVLIIAETVSLSHNTEKFVIMETVQ